MNEEWIMKIVELGKKAIPIITGFGTLGLYQATTNALNTYTNPVVMISLAIAVPLSTIITTLIINRTKRIQITETSEVSNGTLLVQMFNAALADAKEARFQHVENLARQRDTFTGQVKEIVERTAQQLREKEVHAEEREDVIRKEKHRVVQEAGEYKLKFYMIKTALEKEGLILLDDGTTIKLIREKVKNDSPIQT